MTEAQILQMPIKTKLVCSACGAAGAGSCGCGVSYIPWKEKAAADAVAKDPEKSNRVIADELGISEPTVRRARNAGAPHDAPEKRKGKDGKSYPAKPKTKGEPSEKAKLAQAAVDAKLAKGEPVCSKKTAEALGGMSHYMVEVAKAVAHAKLELLKELKVDPATLSPSAQAKLEVCKRLERDRLNKEYAARVKGFDEEVKKRVLVETKDDIDKWKQKQEAADETKALYLEMVNGHKPPFSIEQFNLLRKCLHQNGIAANPQDFDEAFNLIQTKKLQLTGVKG